MKSVSNTGGTEVIRSNWNTFWWIVGSICMPFTIPYIVCKVMAQLRLRKNKDTLQGKVSRVANTTPVNVNGDTVSARQLHTISFISFCCNCNLQSLVN